MQVSVAEICQDFVKFYDRLTKAMYELIKRKAIPDKLEQNGNLVYCLHNEEVVVFDVITALHYLTKVSKVE